MDFFKIIRVVVLLSVISEGLAWFGRDRSSSREISKQSSRRNDGNGSSRRGSGWWGGRRNKPSNPSPRPKPPFPRPKPPSPRRNPFAPRPKPPSPRRNPFAPRPKPPSPRRNPFAPRPKPPSPRRNPFAPRPKPPSPRRNPFAPRPKPKDSGKRKSAGWWSGKAKPDIKKTTERKTKGTSGWFSGTNRNVPPKPKSNPNPRPDTKQEPVGKKNTQPKTDMKKVIEGYEGGIKEKAYDAQPKNPKVHDTTIGIGFNLNRPDAKKTFEKIVPGVNFNDVKSGKKSITKEQARALFNNDIDKIYEPRAKHKIGKDVYDKLPSNVKTAVVNAVFRGDLGPKTSKLIKDGKWKEVGKEYLDHEQYRNADTLGVKGVKTRMDWNKKQFDSMIKEAKPASVPK